MKTNTTYAVQRRTPRSNYADREGIARQLVAITTEILPTWHHYTWRGVK
jgi:hypothetical protein